MDEAVPKPQANNVEGNAKRRRRKRKRIAIPRREPSIKEMPREILYITADKLTCRSCTCFPKEEPYMKIPPKRIRQCQRTPKTLYELAAEQVELLEYPEAFRWSVEEVEAWMSNLVGFPQYVESIRDNRINGLRLLKLEDPSKLPPINIHNFEHIKIITRCVRELYKVEYIYFSRSISLPPRKPMTHVVWFKARTGPAWGVVRTWSKCDILRWMKILNPEPQEIHHMDLVWYYKPDFPKTLFGPEVKIRTIAIERYLEPSIHAKEYKIPRKFHFDLNVRGSQQFIWIKRVRDKRDVNRVREEIPMPYNSIPPGLKAVELLLFRRKMPKQKFFNPKVKKDE